MHFVTHIHKQFLEHFPSVPEIHIRHPLAYIARWKNKQLVTIFSYLNNTLWRWSQNLQQNTMPVCCPLSLSCTINHSHIKILQWFFFNGSILQWLPPVLAIGKQHSRSVSKIWLKTVLEKYIPFEFTKNIHLPTFINKN